MYRQGYRVTCYETQYERINHRLWVILNTLLTYRFQVIGFSSLYLGHLHTMQLNVHPQLTICRPASVGHLRKSIISESKDSRQKKTTTAKKTSNKFIFFLATSQNLIMMKLNLLCCFSSPKQRRNF